MANVQRNRKIGGTNTFESEFQLGFDDIRAMEIDADFDTLYNAWNAGIEVPDLSVTSGKIADGAVTLDKLASGAVDSSKILDGSILEADLDNLFRERIPPVWSPGEANRVLAIDGTGTYLVWVEAPPPGGNAGGDLGGTYPSPTIALLAVTGAKIANATIPNSKLAAGAAVAGAVSANPVASLAFSASTETTMLTFPALAVRGGYVGMRGSWGIYTTGAATGNMTLVVRVKRGSTVIHTVTYTIGTNFTHPIPVPTFTDVNPPAGSHIYSITGQVSGNGIIYSRGTAAENGKLWLEEL